MIVSWRPTLGLLSFKSSLPTFLEAIRDRSTQNGWSDIFTIKIGNDANNQLIERNLLTQYGEITLAQIRTDAANDYIGQPIHNAQVSQQIYQCLKKSITDDVAKRMVTESENYLVNNIPDGPSFLMTLIQVFFIKKEAQPTQLCLRIADAHLLITEHEYNIDSFNNALNMYVQQLEANGQSTEDLFAHLTKAYQLVPDKRFNHYITNRIDQHNDGTRRMTVKT